MATMEEKEKRKIDLENISIRKMKYDEIEVAMKIFSRANLNDSLPTVQSYYESDPDGFFVAIDTGKNDLVIGSCAAPLTTHQTSFIGLYVVEPEYQGLGIGVKLFNRCLDKVDQRNCGLSAVPSKFKVYKDRAGFRIQEGRAMVIVEGTVPDIGSLKGSDKLDRRYRLVTVPSPDTEGFDDLVDRIIKFDESVHLDNRSKLLRIALAKPKTICMAVIDSNDPNNSVVGYGSIQTNIIDWGMPGPVYSINEEIGEVLLCELLRSDSIYYQKGIQYFTIDNSIGGLSIAKRLRLQEVTRCEKLYTKSIPPFNYDYLYCCHTPDFSC